jgi:hypothetical protein
MIALAKKIALAAKTANATEDASDARIAAIVKIATDARIAAFALTARIAKVANFALVSKMSRITQITNRRKETKMQITNEQFGKLREVINDMSHLVREAYLMTETVFKQMPAHKKTGRACVCKMTKDLMNAYELFFKITDLLETMKQGENHD